MSSHIEDEIQHLDFDADDGETHVAHPIDVDLEWCGKKRKTPQRTPLNMQANPDDSLKPSDVTCVKCLQLWAEKGGDWWWRVRRAWYQ